MAKYSMIKNFGDNVDFPVEGQNGYNTELDMDIDYNALKDRGVITITINEIKDDINDYLKGIYEKIKQNAKSTYTENTDKLKVMDRLASVALSANSAKDPGQLRNFTKLKEQYEQYKDFVETNFRSNESKTLSYIDGELKKILSLIKNKNDEVLEDHFHRIRTEVLWIRSQYQEQLENCRLSKAREIHEKRLLDDATLNEKRLKLQRDSEKIIHQCLERFKEELDILRKENESLKTDLLFRQLQLKKTFADLAMLKSAIETYETPLKKIKKMTRKGAVLPPIDKQLKFALSEIKYLNDQQIVQNTNYFKLEKKMKEFGDRLIEEFPNEYSIDEEGNYIKIELPTTDNDSDYLLNNQHENQEAERYKITERLNEMQNNSYTQLNHSENDLGENEDITLQNASKGNEESQVKTAYFANYTFTKETKENIITIKSSTAVREKNLENNLSTEETKTSNFREGSVTKTEHKDTDTVSDNNSHYSFRSYDTEFRKQVNCNASNISDNDDVTIEEEEALFRPLSAPDIDLSSTMTSLFEGKKCSNTTSVVEKSVAESKSKNSLKKGTKNTNKNNVNSRNRSNSKSIPAKTENSSENIESKRRSSESKRRKSKSKSPKKGPSSILIPNVAVSGELHNSMSMDQSSIDQCSLERTIFKEAENQPSESSPRIAIKAENENILNDTDTAEQVGLFTNVDAEISSPKTKTRMMERTKNKKYSSGKKQKGEQCEKRKEESILTPDLYPSLDNTDLNLSIIEAPKFYSANYVSVDAIVQGEQINTSKLESQTVKNEDSNSNSNDEAMPVSVS